MSNICAGIGRGQMQVLAEHIARRRAIHVLYTELLVDVKGVEVMQNPAAEFDSNFWLTCITVDSGVCEATADDIRLRLEAENIESRLLWRPMHMQPVYADCPFYGDGTAERIFNKGLCLPSGSSLTDEQIRAVAGVIKNSVGR